VAAPPVGRESATELVVDKTRVERPSHAVVPERPSVSRTLATPEQALAEVEAQRVRGLMSGMTASSVVTMVIVLLVAGDREAQQLHAAALGGSALLTGLVALWFRDPKRYAPKLALYAILAQLIVLITGYYFWGVFSAYGALVPLTIYIAAGTASRGEVAFGVTVCVLGQGGFALATALGYVPSRGLVEPVVGRADLMTQLVALALLQVITIGAAIAGSMARRDSVKALDEHNKALLELAQREAQLAEAYDDARAAREAGVGGVGRFTDQTIDGFKFGPVLGRGAMGEVYAAERSGDASKIPLAIKLLAPHLLRDPIARERFMRESEIVSKLSSPNIVRVVAVSPKDAPLPYIVMERLEGIDLAQLIKREPVRPLDEVTQLVRHVASALDTAHKAGIIHRDLKPSNIYLTGEGIGRIWKVLDFGASKWRNGEGTLTQDMIVGTPGYMSPEQALGRTIDQRSDVYALGVILYRLLTGVPAVVPGEVPAMLQEVAFRMPVQPSKRGDVPAPIEAVLAVALAKSPVHRFATAGELAYVFVEAASGKLDRGIAVRAEAVLEDTAWGAWQRD
jgi:tRNA A-37 threonylcarbamoyl transferase component Bud32